jgi:Stage II sporulation protein E (SpoIIE)
VSVAYRPADGPAAGGDFYDVFRLDETRVAVVVGDVSGHGRAALARAAQTRFTLRAYLELGMAPRVALAVTGRRPSGDQDEFATVAVGIYDAASGTLTYATAGHPPPIVLGLTDFTPVTACASVPLGWGMPTGRRQTTLALPAHAIACFYSDGLVEARIRGELLGRGRVVEMLAELGPSPQATMLLERLREVADEARDDMAACVIRTTSAATEAMRVEEIELDGRQLSAGRGERFLRACNVPADGIVPVLERARGIVGEFGTAVVRVSFDRSRRDVVVEPPVRDGSTAARPGELAGPGLAAASGRPVPVAAG